MHFDLEINKPYNFRPLTPPEFQLRIRQAIESIELAEAKFGTGLVVIN